MQKICEEYNLTLDELINEDLYLKNKGYTAASGLAKVAEPVTEGYDTEKESLLKTIEAQKETIAAMKITIDTLLHR
jgi:hypothetical protein